MVCDLRDQFVKETEASSWFSFTLSDHLLSGSEMPYCDDAQAATENLHGEERRPPANNHGREPSWK